MKSLQRSLYLPILFAGKSSLLELFAIPSLWAENSEGPIKHRPFGVIVAYLVNFIFLLIHTLRRDLRRVEDIFGKIIYIYTC